jgi:hypothetical protein
VWNAPGPPINFAEKKRVRIKRTERNPRVRLRKKTELRELSAAKAEALACSGH